MFSESLQRSTSLSEQASKSAPVIPGQLLPYATSALNAGQKYYDTPYDVTYAPYLSSEYRGGMRVPGMTETQAGQQFATGILGLQAPGGFQLGQDYARQAGQSLAGLADYQGPQIDIGGAGLGVGQQPGETAPRYTATQLAAPEVFGQPQAQRYMSDYMQSVTDIAKRKALEDAQRAQLQANLGAGRKGAFGASGQILATTERERALGERLSDLQSRGLQEAYLNSQAQFERDRAAQMRTAEQNLGVETQVGLANLTSQLQARGMDQETALRVALANQSSEQEAAQRRLGAATNLGALARTTGELGVMQQASDIDRLKMLGAYSDTERALEKSRRDLEYQDIMRQIQYPEQSFTGLANLVRNIPIATDASSTGRSAAASTGTSISMPQLPESPSFLSQLSGLGLTGLSLYNLSQPR